MATFLDVGLFQYFNVIFPVLLIFAIVFALLQKTKILGANLTINALIAVVLAFMSLFSPSLIKLINAMTPWFVLVFIFLILLLLLYQMMGATDKDIFGALKGDKTIQWALFGVAIVILIASMGSVFGEKLLPITQPTFMDQTASGTEGTGGTTEASSASSSYSSNIYATLFNPKVLGMILIFLIAIFAVAFLSGG